MGASGGEKGALLALSGANADLLDAIYQRYQADPSSVGESWRLLFDGLAAAAPDEAPDAVESDGAGAGAGAEKQGAVSRLLQMYANRAHQYARIDPLGIMKRERPRLLDPGYVGLSRADFDTEFYTGARNDWIAKRATLRDIVARLEQVYGGTIGAEFAHVSDTDERLWLQDEFQLGRVRQGFSTDERRTILRQLTAAEGLERYLHTRFVGQKRFSLEGAESLIAMLDDLVQEAGRDGVEEAVIGMAHRGRLNVLVNVLGKSPGELFSEFEGKHRHDGGSGDVKYHKGFSADLRTPGGNVHVMLAFNPSHLEIVNPVVEGSVRARQERRGDRRGRKVLPILVHGDSAFAGQGVVMETLQLSQTRGYGTGGTIHLVVNNQVGFTTSKPEDTRSTMYCSDVAKMIEAPILHVNGDDPEAVIFCTRFALRYRQKFGKDIVIDLVCYRRLGHNEADEPAATQPVMYAAIRRHPTARKIYADRLATEGALAAADADALIEQYRTGLDEGRPQARASLGMIGNKYTIDWSKYMEADWTFRPRSGVDLERLRSLGARITAVPEGFKLHPRVQQVVAAHQELEPHHAGACHGGEEARAPLVALQVGQEVLREAEEPQQRGGPEACVGGEVHAEEDLRQDPDAQEAAGDVQHPRGHHHGEVGGVEVRDPRPQRGADGRGDQSLGPTHIQHLGV